MKPQRTDVKPDLFSMTLRRVISMDHPLVLLAEKIDWEKLHLAVADSFSDEGCPAKDSRLVLGLLMLKAMFNVSDERVLELWLENPYWQWFCGFEVMQHQVPMHPTSFCKWRGRLGAERLEVLLEESIRIAQGEKLLKEKDVVEVVVDTTVQPKAIAFPTDSRLYFKSIRVLGRVAHRAGLKLRQSYIRVGKDMLFKQHRYAHARQGKRAMRCQKKLHTMLGRLIRDIQRKLPEIKDERHLALLKTTLVITEKIYTQERHSSPKIYSVHEPHVECIAKGKAHKKYEFGNKVSVVVSQRSNFILGLQSLHGNPFDGHTLKSAIEQAVQFTGHEPQHIMVDRGYRGHDYQGTAAVHIAGRIPKNATRSFRKMLKRRSVVEPTIGHLKSDHRLERNFLKGEQGDNINALMSGVGYNLKKLLKHLKASACAWIFDWIQACISTILTKNMRYPSTQVA